MKRIMAIVMSILAIVIVGYFAYGNLQASIPCQQIQENELRGLFIGEQVHLQDLQLWLENSSNKIQEVETVYYDTETSSISWRENRTQYIADFHDNNLKVIHVVWNYFPGFSLLKPTGDDIINCFGQPDLYRSRHFLDYNGEFVEINLVYLQKGIEVGSKPIAYKSISSGIKGTIEMQGISIVPSDNNPEKMLVDLGFPLQVHSEILASLRPWPDKGWEEIEIFDGIQ